MATSTSGATTSSDQVSLVPAFGSLASVQVSVAVTASSNFRPTASPSGSSGTTSAASAGSSTTASPSRTRSTGSDVSTPPATFSRTDAPPSPWSSEMVPTSGSRARGVTAVEMPRSRMATWGGSSGRAESVNVTGSRFTRPSVSVNRTTTVRSASSDAMWPTMVRPAADAAPPAPPVSVVSVAGSVASTTSAAEPPPATATIVAAESGFVAVQAISTAEPRGICTTRAGGDSRPPLPR